MLHSRTSTSITTPAGQGSDRSILINLPVELIAEILIRLDIRSLIVVGTLSRRLRNILSDPTLNPWRGPILRNLREIDSDYEVSLKNLAELSIVPRSCWIDILALARSEYILFEATVPNIPDADYEEVHCRRFLPSWKRWRTDNSPWREVYRK